MPHSGKAHGAQAVDEAYALGLFHDCGVPLMLKRSQTICGAEQAYANAGPDSRVVDTENNAFNNMRWWVITPPSPGACRNM